MFQSNNVLNGDLIDFSLKDTYYKAINDIACCGDDNALFQFQQLHPLEFAFFSAVGRKRKLVRKNIEALKALDMKMYFGTLTFNEEKNKNQVVWKRKEAFKMLHSLFSFYLVVEEYGEDNGRYHIHFVGVFKVGKGFDDFVSSWESRQNLKEVKDIEGVCRYLVKYVSKQLPRIRRSKSLVAFEKEHSKLTRIAKKYEREDKRFPMLDMVNTCLQFTSPYQKELDIVSLALSDKI